jgi:hypothetical protein
MQSLDPWVQPPLMMQIDPWVQRPSALRRALPPAHVSPMTSLLLRACRHAWERLRGAGSCRAHNSNGETGDSLAAADGAKALSTVSLHRDRRTNRGRQPLLHGVTLRRQLGSFADHSTIDVARFEPCRPHTTGDLGEQHDAVGASPLRIGIGEVLADISESSSAKQRISTRMGNNIGIAVAD